jgi:hypothetical protein
MTEIEDEIEVGQIWTAIGGHGLGHPGQHYYLVVICETYFIYCDVWSDTLIVSNFRVGRYEFLKYYSVLDAENAFEIKLRYFS